MNSANQPLTSPVYAFSIPPQWRLKPLSVLRQVHGTWELSPDLLHHYAANKDELEGMAAAKGFYETRDLGNAKWGADRGSEFYGKLVALFPAIVDASAGTSATHHQSLQLEVHNQQGVAVHNMIAFLKKFRPDTDLPPDDRGFFNFFSRKKYTYFVVTEVVACDYYELSLTEDVTVEADVAVRPYVSSSACGAQGNAGVHKTKRVLYQWPDGQPTKENVAYTFKAIEVCFTEYGKIKKSDNVRFDGTRPLPLNPLELHEEAFAKKWSGFSETEEEEDQQLEKKEEET